jgi:hypothetical protein
VISPLLANIYLLRLYPGGGADHRPATQSLFWDALWLPKAWVVRVSDRLVPGTLPRPTNGERRNLTCAPPSDFDIFEICSPPNI